MGSTGNALKANGKEIFLNAVINKTICNLLLRIYSINISI
jgi:hypothetical protein